jgi:hypothetical protein
MASTRDAPTEAEHIALYRMEEGLDRIIREYNALLVEAESQNLRRAIQDAGIGRLSSNWSTIPRSIREDEAGPREPVRGGPWPSSPWRSSWSCPSWFTASSVAPELQEPMESLGV